MQTLGWSGKIWLNRWICISRIYSTLICLGFLAVLLAGVLRANCGACC
jgi:succinate dehydrogenase / fumarate reductase cytochrome b subunit